MEAIADDFARRQVDHWVFAWCSRMQRLRRWQASLDKSLKPHALVGAEFLVLWRTSHAAPPGISQVELARELNVSAAHICGVVEKLQARDWLQTARPMQDRRRLYCSLTTQGCAELQRLITELSPIANQCLLEDAAALARGTVTTTSLEEAA